MKNLNHVLIAGAGIGGLTLACALKKAGIQTTVFERAPELKPLGAGLTVQMNAMIALRSIGLDEAVVAQGGTPGQSAILDSSGRTLTALPITTLRSELGVQMVCIHRARLHRILLDSAGVENVRLGRAVSGYREEGDQVVVQLSDGSECSGDLLVGADGLHSAVRAQLLGPSELRYSGYTSWRGVCPEADFGSFDHLTETWGLGARFGVVPIGHRELYWFATANAPQGERDPAEGPRAKLVELFGDWHAPIPELVRRTPVDRILRTDIHDRPPVSRWTRGRVALLGDAAHPMTPNLGQGGCQAIEDAVVLARCLAELPGHEEALAIYERERVERANGVVNQAWSMGRMGQLDSRTAAFVRDTLLRLTPRGVQLRQVRKLMRFEPRI